MKVIDLSVSLETGMDVFPGDPQVRIEVVHTLDKQGWVLRHLSLGTHTGTHVDAFSHMHEGKQNLEEIPLERFFGEAQVVKTDGDWPQGIGLFFREKVGIDLLQKILQSDPGFVGGTLSEELERALLGKEILTYTGLVNLEQLPLGRTFLFIGFPLKIKAGDGSPVRAVAILTGEGRSFML
ncbi:MAG: cyclase family protein [Firmicutes bacterium]|nr:cyclase family protein [Bacillota bacterium]